VRTSALLKQSGALLSPSARRKIQREARHGTEPKVSMSVAVKSAAAQPRPAAVDTARRSHGTTSQASRVFASHDDMDRDETLHLIEHIREDALGSNVEDRLQKRSRNSRGVFMRANPRRREETAWLETLTISQINDKIAERKAWVIENHIVAGTQKNRTTAMTQYVEFCEIRDKAPVRIDGLFRNLSKLEIKENEDLLIDFAIYQSWRVSPPVVAQYVSHVVSWHLMEVGVDIKEGTEFKRLTKVLKSLRKLSTHEARVRLGLKPSQLKAMIRLLMTKLNKSARSVESRSAYRFILFLTWCFQGLYRGGEGARGNEFDPIKHLTCSDPKITRDRRTVLVRNPELKRSNKHSGIEFPFPVDETDICSFGWWVSQQADFDPLVGGEDPATTPLFPDFSSFGMQGHSRCLSYDDALDKFRSLLGQACPTVDTTLYGLHSMRIGAATSLFAMGCPPLVIQTLGRWASDLFGIYCRANRHQLAKWTAAISNAEYDTLEEMAQPSS
jgi:hypothetical protein